MPPLPSKPAGGKIDGEFFRFGSRQELSDKANDLHAACARGHALAVPELLGGLTPDAVKELLRAKDKELGWTALHLAAAHGQPAVVEVLLQAGASADVEDDYGMTPLHLAAEEGCNESAELLVTKVRERRGSIEYLAERTGHHELGERLSAYWEIVAQIEAQQREEQVDASATGEDPSPNSPTPGTLDREDEADGESASLDESEGALDISLGAIRTVSASELPPPPPPPPVAAIPQQSWQADAHDSTWTPNRAQAPKPEPEPEPESELQVEQPPHERASWQHQSYQAATGTRAAWGQQTQQPLRGPSLQQPQEQRPPPPPLPPQQQQQPQYPTAYAYGAQQPTATMTQFGNAQHTYMPPHPGVVAQVSHLVPQSAVHQEQQLYQYGHEAVSSMRQPVAPQPYRSQLMPQPQPYAQPYNYVGEQLGGGGGPGSMHGYYGGPMESHAGMVVPTRAAYERGRVVHKYEI